MIDTGRITVAAGSVNPAYLIEEDLRLKETLDTIVGYADSKAQPVATFTTDAWVTPKDIWGRHVLYCIIIILYYIIYMLEALCAAYKRFQPAQPSSYTDKW